MKGGGNTALYDAITVYLSRVEDSEGRKVLVLFSDGEDSRSNINISELASLVRSANVAIYAISFAGAAFPWARNRHHRARSFLAHLAELTGGDIYSPHPRATFPGIYQKILDALAGQYVIGFISDNVKKNGKYRKLKVEVNRPELRLRHRPGYQGPSPRPRDK